MSMHKGILGQQFGGATVTQEQTLGEYINRKQRAAAFDAVAQEKKMTFDEWWSIHKIHEPCWRLREEEAYIIWKAGQENV